MAMADYKRCDVCGGKTFYDANLDYRMPGDKLYMEHPRTYIPMPCGVGDWAVLCKKCAQTHEVKVEVKK